jgi:hypothetical protein
MDGGDRGAVGMAEQDTTLKADRVEQGRQNLFALLVHIGQRPRHLVRR